MKKQKAQTKAKQQKSEKNAKAGVSVLMCLVAVCLAAVVGVGSFTDLFKQESEVKAVALVLSQTEETELEAELSRLTPLIKGDFSYDELDAEALLSHMRPYGKDGLYAAYGYEVAEKCETADPAMRFKDEQGIYHYYKTEKDSVDNILSQFEVNSAHTVNTKDFYYYDGYYYFAGAEASDEGSELIANITASKRIQDGRYYMTCEIGGKTVYVIAGKSDGDSRWIIHEISDTPIFDQMGIMIKDEAEGLFDYEIKTQVIEGKTENGTVYCRYALEYPVFYGKTAGETEANRFYQSVLSYYSQLSEQSEAEYKKYIRKGGSESALPLEVNYRAEVTYATGSYIGVLNEITESEAVFESQPTQENLSAEPVVPSKKTVEGYIFDTESGGYVTKDSIIGKNYQLIEELLYRIYCGYDYASLLSEEAEDTAEVPEDTEDVGEEIYAGANTICKDGYMFCFINESGYREDVIIPFSANIFEVEVG